MVANTLKGIYVVLFLCVTAVCGEYCYIFYDDNLIYCSAGCCGSSYNTYCCPETCYLMNRDLHRTVGVIVGAVVGSIVFVAIIVTIIVCVCCKKKTQERSGQVLQPATTTATAVFGVQTAHTENSGQPGYGQPGYS